MDAAHRRADERLDPLLPVGRQVEALCTAAGRDDAFGREQLLDAAFLAAQHPVIQVRCDTNDIGGLAEQILDQPVEEHTELVLHFLLAGNHGAIFFEQGRRDLELVELAALARATHLPHQRHEIGAQILVVEHIGRRFRADARYQRVHHPLRKVAAMAVGRVDYRHRPAAIGIDQQVDRVG